MAGPREYLRFEITDLNGRGLSKTVPVRHREVPVQMYAGALAAAANAEVVVCPSEIAAAGRPNAQLLPDWGTEQVLPWASRPEQNIIVKRVFCEQAGIASVKNEAVPRTICKRLLEELKAFGHQGLEMMVGGEVDFTLARQREGATLWEPLFAGNFLSTLRSNKAVDFCYELERQMGQVGVDVLTMQAQAGPGQVEMTFAPKFGLEAVDAAVTFRAGTKELAQKHDMTATFMGMPFGAQSSQNRGHVNFSIWAGGSKEGKIEQGELAQLGGNRTNVFHSTADAQGMSPTARSFLAGVLAHAPALQALCSPTASCYGSVGQKGSRGPIVADWGLDDRSACMRVKACKSDSPASCYMEFRMPSADANPYLVAAGLVAAGLEGLERSLELGPPRKASAAPAPTQPLGSGALPTTLSDALKALEADTYMVQKLGHCFVRWYCEVKRAELGAIEKRIAGSACAEEDATEAWQHIYFEHV